ncbi:hypothetical protein WJX81_004427 [Elliptochloris bilobata]|uniref:Uncharacterized protein n=1 Tax=Elliptochloris bilobata TaxID=381761 RepID=A0AAW1R129_9CHLO
MQGFSELLLWIGEGREPTVAGAPHQALRLTT